MKPLTNINHEAIGNGGAGMPGAWDIITPSSCDLEGRIVSAFMNLESDEGSFDEMEEETTPSQKGADGVSESVASRYLAFTYPQNIPFEGRYTKLTPASGCRFKVWFLE